MSSIRIRIMLGVEGLNSDVFCEINGTAVSDAAPKLIADLKVIIIFLFVSLLTRDLFYSLSSFAPLPHSAPFAPQSP